MTQDSKSSFNELKELVEWYFSREKDHHHPTETEVSNHIITPLLKICGWSSRQISYERHLRNIGRIDIGLHRSDERQKDSDLVSFIEVKKHIHFNESVLFQAKKYSDYLPDVSKFIISDGYTYDIYNHEKKIVSLSVRTNPMEEILDELSPRSFF